MGKVSRSEFAAICETTIGVINTNVARRKIEVIDKKIDTESMLNVIFIKARKRLKARAKLQPDIIKPVQKKTTEENKSLNKKPPVTRKSRAEREEEAYNANLVLRKLKADTQKAEKDNELKQLQLEKMMGKLIPVDLVHGILKINIQNIFKSFENELINLASIYCDIMAGGDRSKLSQIIETMRNELHRIITETKVNSAKEIKGVINEYAETRSRGERK